MFHHLIIHCLLVHHLVVCSMPQPVAAPGHYIPFRPVAPPRVWLHGPALPIGPR